MSLLAAGTSSDPTSVLLNYSAVGAMLVILGSVLGRFAWIAYKRERDRADRLEAQLQAANDRIIDRLADVLNEVRTPLVEYTDYLRDRRRQRGV